MLLRSAICFSSAAERDFTQLAPEGAMLSSSDALWTIGGDERGPIVALEGVTPPVPPCLQCPFHTSTACFHLPPPSLALIENLAYRAQARALHCAL